MNHLNRKRECESLYSSKPLQEVKLDFIKSREDNKKFKCMYCDTKFKIYSSCKRHLSVCKNKTTSENNDLKQMVLSLSEQITKMQKSIEDNKTSLVQCNNTNHNVIHSNTCNNITTNNIVILRDFGHENMEALPSDLISSLIMDLEYRSLLENLHFDPDYPENHNIRLKSTKRRIIEIYKNNQWNPVPYVKALNDIILHANRIFQNHYRKKKNEIAEDVTKEELEEIERQLYCLQNGLNDNIVKPILKEIEMIVEQYRNGVPNKKEENITISRPSTTFIS